MNSLTRITATIAATLMVSLGAVAISAPAHADRDTSWGYGSTPTPAR